MLTKTTPAQTALAWRTRKFRTQDAAARWIDKNGHRYQWQRVFINNVAYAIEYRPLRVIG